MHLLEQIQRLLLNPLHLRDLAVERIPQSHELLQLLLELVLNQAPLDLEVLDLRLQIRVLKQHLLIQVLVEGDIFRKQLVEELDHQRQHEL